MLQKWLQRLHRVLVPSAPSRVAAHWGDWQLKRDAAAPRFVDWSDHPTVLALLQQDLFGSASITVFDFLKRDYPQLREARALSLCSGDGAFEKQLVAAGVFGSIVGIDLSELRVAQANASLGDMRGRVEFRVGDVNEARFGERSFDVVFAKAALHHVERLEDLWRGIRRCLRPGGRIVTIDYFGPARFQWTDAQLSAANEVLASFPHALLRRADGSLHRTIGRPDVAALVAMDPSEAVRSDELYPQLQANFELERDFAAGGALLNLVLDGTVVNNFDPGDDAHNALIRRAFARERELMASGTLASDFRFILTAGCR